MRGYRYVVQEIVQHALLFSLPETYLATKTKTNGKTPYQYAEQNGHYNCCALINAYYFHNLSIALGFEDKPKITELLNFISTTVTDIRFLPPSQAHFGIETKTLIEIRDGFPQSLIGLTAVKAIQDPSYYEKIFPFVEQYLVSRTVTEQVENYVMGISQVLENTLWKQSSWEPMLGKMLDKLNALSNKFDQVTRLKINPEFQNEALWNLILKILASSPLCEITFYVPLLYCMGSDFYNLPPNDFCFFHANQTHFISVLLNIINNPNNASLVQFNLTGVGKKL